MGNCLEQLKLENQLCFPLYAAAKELVNRYRPHLAALDLTYTQYLAMLVLWEKECINVKELGACLYLDSGTLTPLLNKLQAKGYIEKHRCQQDSRCVIVCLTPAGAALQTQAAEIPQAMCAGLNLTADERQTLQQLLQKVLADPAPQN